MASGLSSQCPCRRIGGHRLRPESQKAHPPTLLRAWSQFIVFLGYFAQTTHYAITTACRSAAKLDFLLPYLPWW